MPVRADSTARRTDVTQLAQLRFGGLVDGGVLAFDGFFGAVVAAAGLLARGEGKTELPAQVARRERTLRDDVGLLVRIAREVMHDHALLRALDELVMTDGRRAPAVHEAGDRD